MPLLLGADLRQQFFGFIGIAANHGQIDVRAGLPVAAGARAKQQHVGFRETLLQRTGQRQGARIRVALTLLQVCGESFWGSGHIAVSYVRWEGIPTNGGLYATTCGPWLGGFQLDRCLGRKSSASTNWPCGAQVKDTVFSDRVQVWAVLPAHQREEFTQWFRDLPLK